MTNTPEETTVTFEEAYRELEKEFAERVEQDNQRWKFESIFLPNVTPKGPVDYVLVGMEPSLGRWARDTEEARRKIENEKFRNFDGTPKDSIIHYCIENYLCPDREAYYLTDLAQGAMLVSSPGAGNTDKYEAWYSLFEKELGLVAKPRAKIISIGAKVGRFLSDKGLYGHVGTIPHYSDTAARYFGKEVAGREATYQKFSEGLDPLPEGTSFRLPESRKKLMFDYKIRFERIREQEMSGWPFWQQEWQRSMAAG